MLRSFLFRPVRKTVFWLANQRVEIVCAPEMPVGQPYLNEVIKNSNDDPRGQCVPVLYTPSFGIRLMNDGK